MSSLSQFSRSSLLSFTLAVLALAAAPAPAAVVVDAGGFEGFSIGPLAGQYGWYSGRSWHTPATISNPGLAGHGQVVTLSLTAPNDPFSFACIDFANQVGIAATVRTCFDLYHQASGSVQWWAYGNNPYWGSANDSDDGLVKPAAVGSTPLISNTWQNIVIDYDLVNGTASSWVNGVQVDNAANVGLATEHKGWTFQFHGPNDTTPPIYIDNFTVTSTPVPEPASCALLGAGLLLALRRRC